MEEREISAIDGILPSLYQRELLTDIECRIIVCSRKLEEKQLTFFRIMMSKSKQTAVQLGELFWAMNYNLHAEEQLKLQKLEYKPAKNESDSPLESKKNPMLNDTVIRCVFGFLPLDDIKNCRVVSRKWNSTAEILLRKRAKIHFSTDDGLRPETFLAVSEFLLPDLPFSSFKFSECENAELYWRERELEDFFEKWGGNVDELDLNYINIESAQDSSNYLYQYDVTPWLKNASKITSLKMQGSEDDEEEEELNMSLSLGEFEFLSKFKTFVMKGNCIETRSEIVFIPMAPLNIELSNITCTHDNEFLEQFHYNDFFDFSQAVTIRLNNCQKKISEATFDISMGDQAFKNTDLLYLNEISIQNWGKARGCVRRMELSRIPLVEKNHLEIQSLQISNSVINFFALPLTVEIIEVKSCEISCSEPFSLPNLKILKLQLRTHNASQFTHFQLDNCKDLKELDISYYGDEQTSLTKMFGIRKLPLNLQVLRMKGNLRPYLTDDSTLEIQGFVLIDCEYGSRFTDYTRIAKNFRVGTLVVVCRQYMLSSTVDIVQFLLACMQKEPKRIIIGMKKEKEDLHLRTPFEGSLFSTIVDKKSNYYEFENSFGIVGKAITRDQFLNGCMSKENESIPFF